MGNTAHCAELAADDAPQDEGWGHGKVYLFSQGEGKSYFLIQQLHH
jgi:hypothetical protein